MTKITKLNNDNYFSDEMNNKYLSVSQFKNFVGMPFMPGCEARALAELKGEYQRKQSDALLVGSYIDIALTGDEKEMQQFKLSHQTELFSSRGPTKGQLKSQYLVADKMIEKVKSQPLMMKTLSGEHQVIMTGKIHGVDWKIKVDSLLDNAIVDLKSTENIGKGYYDPIQQRRVSFVEWYDYILQMAVYQEIVRQNTGKLLPCFLTVVDKQEEPDVAVIQIDNESLADRLASIEEQVHAVQMIKDGSIEPRRCECCEYCRKTKVLKQPINWLEIGGELD